MGHRPEVKQQLMGTGGQPMDQSGGQSYCFKSCGTKSQSRWGCEATGGSCQKQGRATQLSNNWKRKSLLREKVTRPTPLHVPRLHVASIQPLIHFQAPTLSSHQPAQVLCTHVCHSPESPSPRPWMTMPLLQALSFTLCFHVELLLSLSSCYLRSTDSSEKMTQYSDPLLLSCCCSAHNGSFIQLVQQTSADC